MLAQNTTLVNFLGTPYAEDYRKPFKSNKVNRRSRLDSSLNQFHLQLDRHSRSQATSALSSRPPAPISPRTTMA